jgi:hypothetical protein
MYWLDNPETAVQVPAEATDSSLLQNVQTLLRLKYPPI